MDGTSAHATGPGQKSAYANGGSWSPVTVVVQRAVEVQIRSWSDLKNHAVLSLLLNPLSIGAKF